jgi:hypothetical protein
MMTGILTSENRETMGLMAAGRLATCVLCWLTFGCSGSPVQPHDAPLTIGGWTGGGACLTVAADTCDLTSGCGHGQFPRPTVRADGTFEADGTYRIEIGPVSTDPAPPAHFSGVVEGSTLTLKVVPSGSALSPASYTMRPASAPACPRCV